MLGLKQLLRRSQNEFSIKRKNYFWYQGKLISKEEHDMLDWESKHASNNVVSKGKKELKNANEQ